MNKKTFSVVAGIIISTTAMGMTDSEFSNLKTKAESGDADAMCKYGMCYMKGDCVNGDFILAAEWIEKSASKGNLIAIGLCHQYGYGGKIRDRDEAQKWFAKAADENNPDGMFFLGVRAHVESITDKSAKAQKIGEAKQWLQKAADLGHVQSAEQLCRLTKDLDQKKKLQKYLRLRA